MLNHLKILLRLGVSFALDFHRVFMETMSTGMHCQIAMDVYAADVNCYSVAISVKTIPDVGFTYDNIQLQSRANVRIRLILGKTN